MAGGSGSLQGEVRHSRNGRKHGFASEIEGPFRDMAGVGGFGDWAQLCHGVVIKNNMCGQAMGMNACVVALGDSDRSMGV